MSSAGLPRWTRGAAGTAEPLTDRLAADTHQDPCCALVHDELLAAARGDCDELSGGACRVTRTRYYYAETHNRCCLRYFCEKVSDAEYGHVCDEEATTCVKRPDCTAGTSGVIQAGIQVAPARPSALCQYEVLPEACPPAVQACHPGEVDVCTQPSCCRPPTLAAADVGSLEFRDSDRVARARRAFRVTGSTCQEPEYETALAEVFALLQLNLDLVQYAACLYGGEEYRDCLSRLLMNETEAITVHLESGASTEWHGVLGMASGDDPNADSTGAREGWFRLPCPYEYDPWTSSMDPFNPSSFESLPEELEALRNQRVKSSRLGRIVRMKDRVDDLAWRRLLLRAYHTLSHTILHELAHECGAPGEGPSVSKEAPCGLAYDISRSFASMSARRYNAWVLRGGT